MKNLNEKELIVEYGQYIRDIGLVNKMGGRGSLFGNLAIFEIIMREKHDLMTDDEIKKCYPFHGFTAFECYGNICNEKYTVMAIRYCREELEFTDDEFIQLCKWFSHRGSPDVYVAMYFICKEIFNEELFKTLMEE